MFSKWLITCAFWRVSQSEEIFMFFRFLFGKTCISKDYDSTCSEFFFGQKAYSWDMWWVCYFLFPVLSTLVWVLNTSPSYVLMQTVLVLVGSLLTKSALVFLSVFLPEMDFWSCLTMWNTNLLLGDSRPLRCDPNSPPVLVSYCNPGCVLLRMHLIFSTLWSCCFIPVCYLMLLRCLECRHLAPHSV